MVNDQPCFFNDLNLPQQQAVAYNEGPSLIIAGAGSGKTRVLTYKIAYLLAQGVPAYRILALTFTNKAAREMKNRIGQLVGAETARHLWMGTFHSIFRRILKAEAELLGYSHHFSIYDTADTKSLLKNIAKQMQLNDKVYRLGLMYDRISMAKNNLQSPDDYANDPHLAQSDRTDGISRMPQVYAEYVRRCRQADAMDFDDLLYYTNVLFRDHPDRLAFYQSYFHYILVDEYQDTNFSQYLIIKKLADQHHRISVVGDDAQSIYSFRGANIDNILGFQRTYPQTQLFKLEQNYRSTQMIVNAANSLISNNKEQIQKNVFSENELGEPLHVLEAFTDGEEAEQIGDKISMLKRMHTATYDQVAVLYRTNAQSRVLEAALRKRGIHYRIYGGQSFYQRKEIKDALAYMRLVVNPYDEESLRRIINVPARGIGDTTLAKLWDAADLQQTSVWSVLQDPLKHGVNINGGTQKKLAVFSNMLHVFGELSVTLTAYELADEIIKTSGLAAATSADKNDEGIDRHENLQELLNAIREFVEQRQNEGELQPLLADFLGEVSLMTDMDENEDESRPAVTLMTVHAAKGLEFDTVFVAGLEEDLFPSQRAMSDRELEEERRLLYVAITRAEKRCYLSFARSRFRNGKTDFAQPSRFFFDIDACYLDSLPSSRYNRFSDENDVSSGFRGWQEDVPRSAFVYQEKEPVRFTASRKLVADGGKYLKTEEKNIVHTPGLEPDSRVCHKVFGEGTVVCCYEENGNVKVDVLFDKGGKKSLLTKFAKLEKL